MKINPVILLVLIVFHSCTRTSAVSEKAGSTQTLSSVEKNSIEAEEMLKKRSDQLDTLAIDYASNKDLLEILPLIPDSAMSMFKWPQAERKAEVAYIARHNYIVNKIQYFEIIKVTPVFFQKLVVDGNWTMSLYKIATGNFIVITHHVYGDQNDFNSFEYTNGILKPVLFNDLFGDYFGEFLENKSDASCRQFLKDNDMAFSYSFEREDSVTIRSEYLNRERAGKCLQGNSSTYVFNPAKKSFERREIIWR